MWTIRETNDTLDLERVPGRPGNLDNAFARPKNQGIKHRTKATTRDTTRNDVLMRPAVLRPSG